MPRYAVEYTTDASTIVYVEADSKEDALDQLHDFPMLCARCSGWGQRDNSGIEIGIWEQTGIIDEVDERGYFV